MGVCKCRLPEQETKGKLSTELRKLCLTATYNVSRSRHCCSGRQAQLALIKQLQVSSFYFRSTKIFNKSALPSAACQTPQSHLRLNFHNVSAADSLSFLISSRSVDLFTRTPHSQISDVSEWPQLKTYPPQLMKGSVNRADCSVTPRRQTRL